MTKRPYIQNHAEATAERRKVSEFHKSAVLAHGDDKKLLELVTPLALIGDFVVGALVASGTSLFATYQATAGSEIAWHSSLAVAEKHATAKMAMVKIPGLGIEVCWREGSGLGRYHRGRPKWVRGVLLDVDAISSSYGGRLCRVRADGAKNALEVHLSSLASMTRQETKQRNAAIDRLVASEKKVREFDESETDFVSREHRDSLDAAMLKEIKRKQSR